MKHIKKLEVYVLVHNDDGTTEWMEVGEFDEMEQTNEIGQGYEGNFLTGRVDLHFKKQ